MILNKKQNKCVLSQSDLRSNQLVEGEEKTTLVERVPVNYERKEKRGIRITDIILILRYECKLSGVFIEAQQIKRIFNSRSKLLFNI